MEPTTFSEFANHLEFLSYDVTLEEGRFLATHPDKMNLLARLFPYGIIFTAGWNPAPRALEDKAGFLEFVNYLNRNAIVCRAYLDRDSALVFEAWHPADYDRKRFGVFMDIWHRDTIGQLREASEISRIYLGD